MADMLKTITDMLTFINANLSDAVSIIEARNSVSLSDLKETSKYIRKGNQFPSLYIIPIGTEEAPVSAGNRPYYGNPNNRNQLISIRVYDRGNKTSADKVETNIIGYMDSLEELFKSDYSLSGIKGIDILDTVYSELIPDFTDNNFLVKMATFNIRVRYNLF